MINMRKHVIRETLSLYKKNRINQPNWDESILKEIENGFKEAIDEDIWNIYQYELKLSGASRFS